MCFERPVCCVRTARRNSAELLNVCPGISRVSARRCFQYAHVENVWDANFSSKTAKVLLYIHVMLTCEMPKLCYSFHNDFIDMMVILLYFFIKKHFIVWFFLFVLFHSNLFSYESYLFGFIYSVTNLIFWFQNVIKIKEEINKSRWSAFHLWIIKFHKISITTWPLNI